MSASKLDLKIRKQIDTFIVGMEEKELNQAWVDRIESILKDNSEAQKYYLDKLSMLAHLEYSLKAESTEKAYQRAKSDILPQVQTERISPVKLIAIAALVLVGIGIGYLINNKDEPLDHQPVIVENVVEEKTEEFVEKELEEAFAFFAQDIGSVWKNKEKPFDFSRGEYELLRGRAQLILSDGALVSIEAPAKFKLESETPIWQEGVFVFEKDATPELYNVEIGSFVVKSLRGKLGFRAQNGKYSCTQLGGESQLVVSRDYAGVTLQKRLNRSQGIRWQEGMYIDGIIGTTRPYTDLEMAFQQGVELLANAHFEFPRMEQDGFVSPSGWNVKLFPSMMAKVSHTNVAGLKLSNQRVANNQWGLLLCERQKDGTMYGSSFEQQIPKAKRWEGKTLQFNGKYKLDQNIPLKEPLSFRAGFYSGISQSEVPLEVIDIVLQPQDQEVNSFSVNYNNFVKPIFKKELYVRVEVMVLGDFGKQGLLVDDLSLTILKD